MTTYKSFFWDVGELTVELSIPTDNSYDDIFLYWNDQRRCLPQNLAPSSIFKIWYQGNMSHWGMERDQDHSNICVTINYRGMAMNIPMDIWETFRYHYAFIHAANCVDRILAELPGEHYAKDRVRTLVSQELHKNLKKFEVPTVH